MSVFKNKGNDKSKQPDKSAKSESKAVPMGDQSQETLAKASNDKAMKDKSKPSKA